MCPDGAHILVGGADNKQAKKEIGEMSAGVKRCENKMQGKGEAMPGSV